MKLCAPAISYDTPNLNSIVIQHAIYKRHLLLNLQKTIDASPGGLVINAERKR